MHSYKSIRLWYLILSLVTGSCLLSACSKDRACPPTADLGFIAWTEQSLEWFPSSYFDPGTILVFRDSLDNVNTFTTIHSATSDEDDFHILPVPCPEGDDIIQTSFGTTFRATRWVSSNGQMMHIAGQTAKKTTPFSDTPAEDFYDVLMIDLHPHLDPFETFIGKISLVTDFRNCTDEEITPYTLRYTHHDSLLIGSIVYKDVYSSVVNSSLVGNLYLQRGKGIIGFLDNRGILWLLE